MIEPKTFFDDVMSPFMFMPLLQFTFSGGDHTKQGAELLKVVFWNLYQAKPNEADLDVIEINFGFQLVAVAGISAEEKKTDNQEFSAIQQEE